MRPDCEKAIVQVVENDMITISIEEYRRLLDHDTRFKILRAKVKNAIDKGEYSACSEIFLRTLLNLLDYTKPEPVVKADE